MRIAITGATGFVGSALVRRLLAENADLRILARPSTKAGLLEARGAQIIRGDLRDDAALARLVAGTEVVYHLAAKVDSRGSKAEFMDANVHGTQRLLIACLAAGVRRVVYASSIAVYGLAKPGGRIDESTLFDDQPQRRDLYAQSKILADQFATSFSEKTSLPIAVIRPGIIYGPGKPLPIGLLGFRAGSTNVVFGNPVNRFPLIYIENLIDAMRQAANPERPGLQQFNIIDDDDLTLAAYHAARSAVDGTKSLFLPAWPVQFAASTVGVSRHILPIGSSALSAHQVRRALEARHYITYHVRDELGWTPKVPLREALEQSVKPPLPKK
jgi:nucleoside-diphosphate-sugar epimerase